jgi:dihydrofolate reductase
MNAIVAVTQDWGIGRKGDLLINERADMQHFVRHTRGQTVVMGDRTLASFPGGRPLKGRRNVVMTIDPTLEAPACPEGTTCEIVHSVDEALAAVASEDPDTVWAIGGASVYRQLLPHCARAVVTKFETTLPADVYFPNLDEDEGWELAGIDGTGVTDAGIAYDFATYRNLRLNP